MGDTREKLSITTVTFHWLIALSVIGMLAFGMIIDDMPRSPEKGFYIGLHKSFGLLILALAAARIFWRLGQGMPTRVGVYPKWQNALATASHVTLLVATLAMPLSGIFYSIESGREVALFGLPVIPKLMEQDKAMADFAFEVHGTFGWILIGVIVLHVAGALKHHVLDKDGTLRRMLGARVDTGPSKIA